jgi:cellulose synthase/poly-beta-1,6-N-acetylglucosamine synthase-like glycosyltransferase
MNEAHQLALILATAVVAYVYLGYPFLLFVLTFRKRHTDKLLETFPRVTMLISAYNERKVIEEKIRNSLMLDYPSGLLEILILSDCSDDGTDEIVLRYSRQGVQLIRSPRRVGKSEMLNIGVSQSQGNVLLFSDANAIYRLDAIRCLVRHFSDSAVGYVVGKARYVDSTKTAAANSEGLYWKLETWLKEKESEFGSLVGGDGAIYAIRRELYTPLRATDINDFLNPLQIVAKGFRGVYEPSASCFEEAGDTFEKEFHRKVRIVSRSFNAVLRAPRVLLPWVQPRHWLALVSHKILRWFTLVFLVFALLANLALWSSSLFRVTACVQLAFYLLAAIGWSMQSPTVLPRFLYLPYYFCLANLAALIGIVKCLTGSLEGTWRTVRHENQDEIENQDKATHLAKKEI